MEILQFDLILYAGFVFLFSVLWFFSLGFLLFGFFGGLIGFFLYFIISVSSLEISQGSLHREHMIVPYIIFTGITLFVHSFAAHHRREESQW